MKSRRKLPYRLRSPYVRDNATQLRLFLENRNISYTEKSSRSTRSLYYVFFIGKKQFVVRISDHPPSPHADQKFDLVPDISVDPHGKGTIQHVRSLVRKLMKKCPKYKHFNY